MRSPFRRNIAGSPDQDFIDTAGILASCVTEALRLQHGIQQQRIPVTDHAYVVARQQGFKLGQGAQQGLRLLQTAYIQNTLSTHLIFKFTDSPLTCCTLANL